MGLCGPDLSVVLEGSTQLQNWTADRASPVNDRDHVGIRYCRLGTADLAIHRRLRPAHNRPGRGGPRKRLPSICAATTGTTTSAISRVTPSDHTLGLEVRHVSMRWMPPRNSLSDAGFTVSTAAPMQMPPARRVMGFINVRRPHRQFHRSGGPPLSFRASLFSLARDAGITEFSHVGLKTTDAPT